MQKSNQSLKTMSPFTLESATDQIFQAFLQFPTILHAVSGSSLSAIFRKLVNRKILGNDFEEIVLSPADFGRLLCAGLVGVLFSCK